MKRLLTIFFFYIFSNTLLYGYTSPRFYSLENLAKGNSDIVFFNNRYGMYYNPALMDGSDQIFYLTLTDIGFAFERSFLDFSEFVLTNLLNFKRFTSNPEYINKSFQDKTGVFDMRYLHLGNYIEADIQALGIGLGVWGYNNLAVSYDDGVYFPIVRVKGKMAYSSQISYGFRLLKQLSMGISLRYWIYPQDYAFISILDVVNKIEGDDSTTLFKDTSGVFYQLENGSFDLKDYTHLSLDLGYIYYMKNIRIGFVIRDLVHVLSTDKVDKSFDIGFGYRFIALEDFFDINRIIYTFSISDLTGDYALGKKINTGMEVSWIPIGFMVGISQGYPTWGFFVRYVGVKVSFASYAEEEGDYPGVNELRTYRFGIMVGY